jgi:hypothetical protein
MQSGAVEGDRSPCDETAAVSVRACVAAPVAQSRLSIMLQFDLEPASSSDITLARKHLDWEPKVPLREGLVPTIEWFHLLDLRKFWRERRTIKSVATLARSWVYGCLCEMSSKS